MNSEIRLHISRTDIEINNLRNEILVDIELMLKKKEFYNINDGTGNLGKVYMSELDEVEEWEGDEEISPVIESKGNNGETIIERIDELDVETVIKIADLMCNEYDTL